jgi:hypothetical protein
VDKVKTAGRKIPGHGHLVGEVSQKENTRTWSLGARSISKGKHPDMVTWCEKYLKRKTSGQGHLVGEVFQKENDRTWSLGGRRISKGKYPDMVTWWEKYLKRKIRFLVIQEGTARTREDMINENFIMLL